MPGFDPSAILSVSTLNDYLKSKVEPIHFKSVFFGGLKAFGRESFGHGGLKAQWEPVIRRRQIRAVDPYNISHAFPSYNRRIKVELGWTVYALGEKIAKIDRLANKGEARLYDLVDDVIPRASSDFIEDMKKKVYIDGSSSTRELFGLQSFNKSTELLDDDSPVGKVTGTYAGKTMAYGGLGGSWTGTLPEGSGTHDYLAWTPFILDVNHSFFGGGTWIENWANAISYAHDYHSALQDRENQVCILNTQWIHRAKRSLRDQERFIASKDTELTKLGFKTLEFEGLELAHEHHCPSGLGFMFNWESFQLRSMQDQLVAYEDDHKIESGDDLYAFDAFIQLLLECPCYLTILKEISSAGS